MHERLWLTLKSAGYDVIETNEKGYQHHTDASAVIVDVKHRGVGVITALIKQQQLVFPAKKHNPPILAVVDAAHSNKQRLFELGAFDYISSPLLVAELKVRIQSAIYHLSQSSLPDISTHCEYKVAPQEIVDERAHQAYFVLAEKTVVYLSGQLGNAVNLEQLATLMGTNRNKLGKSFKACFGVTIFSWLLGQRMLLAAQLLDSTSLAVIQIAEKVGYPDSNNFSTAFKRTFHHSPLKYRKVQRQEQTMQQSKKLVQQAKEYSRFGGLQ
jgi:AraC-like DNA-binding protein